MVKIKKYHCFLIIFCIILAVCYKIGSTLISHFFPEKPNYWRSRSRELRDLKITKFGLIKNNNLANLEFTYPDISAIFYATYHNRYFGSWHYNDCYHNHHQNTTFQCNTYLPFVGEYEVQIHLFLSGAGRELLESSFGSKKHLNMEWDFELKSGTTVRCNSNDKLSNNKTCKMNENYFPEIYCPKIIQSFNCENSNIKSVSIVREPARNILKKFQKSPNFEHLQTDQFVQIYEKFNTNLVVGHFDEKYQNHLWSKNTSIFVDNNSRFSRLQEFSFLVEKPIDWPKILTNSRFYILGDSTIRSWYDFLTAKLSKVSFGSDQKSCKFTKFDPKNWFQGQNSKELTCFNTKIEFMTHGFPLHNLEATIDDLVPTKTKLTKIVENLEIKSRNNASLITNVLILGFGPHFYAFSESILIKEISIQISMARIFLEVSNKNSYVFIKLPAYFDVNPDKALCCIHPYFAYRTRQLILEKIYEYFGPDFYNERRLVIIDAWQQSILDEKHERIGNIHQSSFQIENLIEGSLGQILSG